MKTTRKNADLDTSAKTNKQTGRRRIAAASWSPLKPWARKVANRASRKAARVSLNRYHLEN